MHYLGGAIGLQSAGAAAAAMLYFSVEAVRISEDRLLSRGCADGGPIQRVAASCRVLYPQRSAADTADGLSAGGGGFTSLDV